MEGIICKRVVSDMMYFSVRLRELRKAKRLTQKQLAQRVGVTRGMVSAMESDMRYPSYPILIRLAAVLGTTTDYLLCVDGKRMIDISDLSDREAAAVHEMVLLLMAKKQIMTMEAMQNEESGWSYAGSGDNT